MSVRGGGKVFGIRRRTLLALLVAAVSLVCVAVALAAAPSNDNRADAQQIALGSSTKGTTTDATVEDGEPFSECGPTGPSVWYRIDGTDDGRVIAFLQASGDLDVIVDVYLRQRSQITPLSCDASDTRGRASTDFDMKKGQSYLIRVAQRPNSVAGDFTLMVDLAQPEATPPGRPLPSGGGTGTVQRVFEPSNAWSARMHSGVTYRVNLSARSCVRLAMYGPHVRSFDSASPRRTKSCGGYFVFTPGPGRGGTYSFLVEPNSRRRSEVRYHLQVARAGVDDTAPGVFMRNHARERGALDAEHVDLVDIYRFDVLRPSFTDLTLTGSGNFDVLLVGVKGKRIACSCGDDSVHVKTGRGRYYAVVRAHRHATGHYRLARASKTITRTHLSPSPSTTGPHGTVDLRVSVPPGVDGPVRIVVERFDPLEGYQFLRVFHRRAHGGRASVAFDPPSVGRYRARARFVGTRNAAQSRSGWKSFRVEEPLREKMAARR